MSNRGNLLVGGASHRVLSVASLTPRTIAELLELAHHRYGVDASGDAGNRNHAHRLARMGLLEVTGTRHNPFSAGRPAALYVITPKGEDELTRLWKLEHGRTAA